MSSFRHIALILLLLGICSCESVIYFDQAQPLRQSNLESIPHEFHGTYLEVETDKEDQSIYQYYVIDDQMVIDRTKGIMTLTLDEIAKDIDLRLSGNMLYTMRPKHAFPVEKVDSLVHFPVDFMEPIGGVREEGHCFRSYKDMLIWNQKKGNEKWKVSIAQMDGELLYFWQVQDHLWEQIGEHTAVKTIHNESEGDHYYQIDPTSAEFKKILKLVKREDPKILKRVDLENM